jgi:hypothetical protein
LLPVGSVRYQSEASRTRAVAAAVSSAEGIDVLPDATVAVATRPTIPATTARPISRRRRFCLGGRA